MAPGWAFVLDHAGRKNLRLTKQEPAFDRRAAEGSPTLIPRKSWIALLAAVLASAGLVLLLAHLHQTDFPSAASCNPAAGTRPVSTQQPAILPTPVPIAGTTFDDEFNGAALDTSAWVALSRPGDRGNNEIGCYRPSNVAMSGGALVLTTRVDSSCSGCRYTSAMVQWRTFSFLYGTIEIRAREAGGRGTWPALWLLGADCQQTNITTPDNVGTCNWPAPGSDEVDIAETKGGNLTLVNEWLISNAGIKGCQAPASDVSSNWHTYSLVWQPGSLIWRIDGTVTCSLQTADVPSRPMFLIINTAVGGNGGGAVDDRTLPQTHSIDYVRVSQ